MRVRAWRPTRFEPADLRALATAFAKASDVSGFLTPESFDTILKLYAPRLASSDRVTRLYNILDTSGDGRINFRVSARPCVRVDGALFFSRNRPREHRSSS